MTKDTSVGFATSPVLPAPLDSCVVVNVFQSAVKKFAIMSVDVQIISNIHLHRYTQVYINVLEVFVDFISM